MSIGDIRKIEAGAARTLRDFERGIKTVERRMVKAAQIRGRKAFKKISKRYERSIFVNRRGKVSRLGKYSKKHGRRKHRLNLSIRRGHMREGISKQVKSPKAFRKTKKGFVISLEAPDLTVTGRATVGKSMRTLVGKRILGKHGGKRTVIGAHFKKQNTDRSSFRVNRYLDHYAAQKADGLGSISQADEKKLEREVSDAAVAHIQAIRGAKRDIRRDVAVRVEISLANMFRDVV